MKLTKLLAMLLALCMILCCFAACGGKDDDKDEDEDEKVEEKDKDEDDEDDDDKSKDDDDKSKDDEDDEDDKSKDDEEDDDDKSKDDEDDEDDKDDDKVSSKSEGIEGKWEASIDYAELLASQADIDVDADLDIVVGIKFYDDGEFEMSCDYDGDVDEFIEAYVDAAIELTMDMVEVSSTDELEDFLIQSGAYDSFEEFYEYGYSSCESEIESWADDLDGENGDYEYEDGVLVLEGDVEFEIDLDGDEFVVESVDAIEFSGLFEGAKFERQ